MSVCMYVEGVRNDTIITMIWPVFCFALEEGNIVGEAMNFGFYNITKTLPNFPHPSWSHTHSYLCLATIFEKSRKNIMKFPRIFS